MRLELGRRQPRVNGHAVVDDMQIRLPEVNSPHAVTSLDVTVPDIPFLRHGPIEDLRSGGNFRAPDVDFRGKHTKRLPYAVAGDAAAYRVERADPIVELGSERAGIQAGAQRGHIHEVLGRHSVLLLTGDTKSGYDRSR